MKANTRKTIKYFAEQAKTYKWLLITMTFAMCGGVMLSMYFPFLAKAFVNTMVDSTDKSQAIEILVRIVIYIVVLDIFMEAFWRLSEFLNTRFQTKIMANIYNQCFEYMHKHSYNFFNNNFVGGLVKKVGRLVRAFEGIADKIYWDALPLTVRIFIIWGVLTYLSPALGGIIFAWTVLFVAIIYLVSRFKFKFDVKKAKADTQVTANLADTITNNTNVKLFSGHEFEGEKFGEVTDDWRQKTKTSWDVNMLINAAQSLLMIVLEGSVFYTSAVLWQKGVLTVGDIVLIQAYLLDLFIHLWGFGRMVREVYEYFADAEEMIVILNKKHEVKDKKNACKLIVHHGKVEFRNVNFSYEKGNNVIKDLSFKVKAGEKIALIGPSGGGKTTIMKLLLRLFDIKKGQILIDGENIANVTQGSLRENVSLVPQDPILFHRTLMENIRYGRRDAPEEEVVAAAKMAHCHEFIEKCPKKYQTYVGERGVKLSGGERQRVAIARAILSNTKILVLDEATSQLDSESEKLIQDALKNLMKNKTTFIIAHRLSTIMETDRVFVLKDGEIVEEGDHSSLVSEKGSLYKRLWDLQVGGYLEG